MAEGATLLERAAASQDGEIFTHSGKAHLARVVAEYQADLESCARQIADETKAPDSPTEITHDHVSRAAKVLALRFAAPKTPRPLIVCQAFEYLLAAAVGAFTGFLSKPFGIAGFGLSLALGVGLFVWRMTHSHAG